MIYLWVGLVALGAASTIFFDPRYTGAVLLGAVAVAVVVTVISVGGGKGLTRTWSSSAVPAPSAGMAML